MPYSILARAYRELQTPLSTTYAHWDFHMMGKDTIGRTPDAWLYLPRYKIIILQDLGVRCGSRTTYLKRVAPHPMADAQPQGPFVAIHTWHWNRIDQ